MLSAPRALEYDWRRTFGFGLAALVADRVSVAEAVALTEGVLADTGSHTFAALAKWTRPVDETSLILANLLDGYAQTHSKDGAEPDPWPRPWVVEKPKASPAEIEAGIAALKASGPRAREGD